MGRERGKGRKGIEGQGKKVREKTRVRVKKRNEKGKGHREKG